MATVEPPNFWLGRYGREWVPGILFTRSRDRAEFIRLADWLCREFGAEVVERYGGEGEEDKEYWTLRASGSDWLLMRCFYPRGISLDGKSPRDLEVFERIAAAVGAAPVGWRHRWVRFRRWLAGGEKPGESNTAHGRGGMPAF
ncbi:MAG: hypothetical protein ACJ8F7_23360 [Gemmataceae bacterium]